MTHTRFDTTCIGNAIVDVISKVDDAFLEREQLVKNSMNLIDEARAEELYGHMGAAVEISGGSAGNTAAGVASLGGSSNYIGKVKDDQLGAIFAHDIRALGVNFETTKAADGPATARSFILVTPDAHRTMNTYLGACVELSPEDINPEEIASSQVTYMEGYLWDPEGGKAAFRKAADISHEAGQRVSLTLSDSFCVDRYRNEFKEFINGGVDILFANEDEIKSLYQTDDLAAAIDAVRGQVELACVTRSAEGSVIIEGDTSIEIAADTSIEVVDTTGAGDLYAAGFLYGFTNGRSLAESGAIASIAAAEVISHVGARPEKDLKELIKARL
ncbi:adenosine kinase [Sneathiella sp. P13V-1]|uniref:adenosine kinase n=1 Tax=Sneathiella sp. P13V-1 TaxID=2697366 RepID=UPI00187B73E9|nr:adenosine kinase [Sneathiella sp. P13V-1]MBE7635804.1 adenosine kinase [Sneathiella sp. P13V-1]